MTALAVDFGYILVEKAKLTDALDAAALAGAQDLLDNPDKAGNIALEYASSNGIDHPEILIDQSKKEITVQGTKTVPFVFAKAFGFNQKILSASSKAMVKPISGGTGFTPIGVVKKSYEFGKLYQLKYSPSNSYNGNFGALALGGSGASIYRNNLVYGYQGELKVGMSIPTETGNMSGPTKTGIEERISLDNGDYTCGDYLTASRSCNRILFMPMIDSLQVNGSGEVTIVGFAAFYLEGVDGNGSESVIRGRFIQTVFPGDWDETGQSDYGLYAIKLVN